MLHAKRTRARALAVLVFTLILLLGSQSPAIAAVRIASWNLKHLGWNNDKDLEAVASVIERFDLVALQEVMKPTAAKKLAAIVSKQSGDEWGIALSHALSDNSYKESYKFLWRKSVIENEGGTTVYLDPGKRILLGDFNMPPGDEAWSQFDILARPDIT